MTDLDVLTSLANEVLVEWDSAMERFFEQVDRRRRERKLTDAEVERALAIGYGDEVSDAWAEWVGQS